MYFSDKTPGEVWQPEEASRYNAVNALLRNSAGMLKNNDSFSGYCQLDFYNASEQEIEEFTAVAITGDCGEMEPEFYLSRQNGFPVVNGVPAADGSLPWGIAQERVAPGQLGSMIVSGLTAAYFTGTGQMLVPGSDGLTAGESGCGRVILNPCEQRGMNIPGVILLGAAASAAAPADEYAGIFKLRALTANSLEIVNGSVPSSRYCGYTDVPGWSGIACQTIQIDSAGEQFVYLAFTYDSGTESYSAEFVTSLPDDTVFFLLLGTFNAGSVTQVFKSSTQTVEFGDSWYLV